MAVWMFTFRPEQMFASRQKSVVTYHPWGLHPTTNQSDRRISRNEVGTKYNSKGNDYGIAADQWL